MAQLQLLLVAAATVLLLAPGARALDNGLARRPPMGWLSWVRFACETDCVNYPQDCIDEQLYRTMADHLVEDGYAAVGYQYVNVDDCWAELARDPDTEQLVADHQRFPSGIKALADYIHSRGLKAGIYGDIGTKTCAGYPGFSNASSGELTNYFMLDSETFAEWGIDSLKVDGCYANPERFWVLYPRLGGALNLTGRPILYSCSWPAYQEGSNPDYEAIARSCNLWRNYDDIMDSWQSVLSIVDFYAKNQETFAAINGPGQWFDADMLIIGNFGLSLDQARAQMALWCIWSVPLFMSVDLRTITADYRAILQNQHLIAVNQDELGLMGQQIYNKSDIQIWTKRILPVINGRQHSHAVVYFNRRTLGAPVYVSQNVEAVINDTAPLAPLYNVYDLFDDAKLIARLGPGDQLKLRVNPSGVRMVKLVPQWAAQRQSLFHSADFGNGERLYDDQHEPTTPQLRNRPQELDF